VGRGATFVAIDDIAALFSLLLSHYRFASPNRAGFQRLPAEISPCLLIVCPTSRNAVWLAWRLARCFAS